MPFGPWAVCSAGLYSFHDIQVACKPFSQLPSCLARFLNGTILLCIIERGPTSKLDDQFINRWPIYKLLKFAISSQHILHSDTPWCYLEIMRMNIPRPFLSKWLAGLGTRLCRCVQCCNRILLTSIGRVNHHNCHSNIQCHPSNEGKTSNHHQCQSQLNYPFFSIWPICG